MAEANRDQIEHWNAKAGPVWVAFQEQLDTGIREHGRRALDALALAPGERVLDLGCGCGDTTLDAARRVAASGEVVGVDISGPMLARARERAAAAGQANARFVQSDAQTDELGSARFDAAVSRFGVMFFEDPATAFANVARALRPGGRLAFVCWQPPQANPWIREPMAAVAPWVSLPPPPPPGAPGMFSLADPARIRSLLEGAGFTEVSVEGEELPMILGAGDLDEAVATFLEVGPVASALREAAADETQRARVASAVREVFARHLRDGRPVLGSAFWRVRALRT